MRSILSCLSLFVLVLAAGCKENGCPAFAYQPRPLPLILLDEQGESICIEAAGRRGGPELNNALLPGNVAPQGRDAGYNETLKLSIDSDACEYTLQGWFDLETGKAVTMELIASPDYQPNTFTPPVTLDECGTPISEPLTLTLQEE